MATTTAETATTASKPINLPQVPSSAPPSEDRPTPDILAKAGEVTIYDADGKGMPFKNLFKEGNEFTMVIFIRHFYCGLCQEYITALSNSIPETELSSKSPKINMCIIGCGGQTLIKGYKGSTNCPYPIYTDPTQKLHETLGLSRTLAGGEKPKYVHSSVWTHVRNAIGQSLAWGAPLKGGDIQQVGGEYMWAGQECVWVHRMKTTRDHLEPEVVRKVLGLDG